MCTENQNSGNSMADSEVKTTKLGPCGGHSGTAFDDGSHSKIKEIAIKHGQYINSVQVSYVDEKGELYTAESHGWGLGSKTVIRFDEDEYVKGVSGWVGSYYNHHDDFSVIRSLSFETNKRTYGPYGEEKGMFFSLVTESGCVVGLFGNSCLLLYAIGIRVAYVQSSIPVSKPIHHTKVVVENVNVYIN